MYKPAIIVPYRNRPEHLSIFVPAMRAYLPDADIIVVEQADDKPFNRGKLINIGFLETEYEYFVAHDVDMVPIDVDYSIADNVTQLASSNIQINGYLGGVTMFSADTFERVGGYQNGYFSRAEDNELWFNLRRMKIPITEKHGKFKELPHSRNGAEFIPSLWKAAQQKRENQHQLADCQYKVISKEQKDGYTLIKVEL